MSDARKAERVRSLLSGQVQFNNNASTLDCVIKNISGDGARLAIGDSTALPAEFDLNIPHKGRTFRARIVWRGDGMVGVEFIQAGAAAKPALVAGEPGADQVEALLRENAKLKAQILELKLRISQLTEGV